MPEHVDASGFELLFDESQGTALFIGYFETEQKLRDANEVFDAMDASQTPGSRASVDLCEVKAQQTLA